MPSRAHFFAGLVLLSGLGVGPAIGCGDSGTADDADDDGQGGAAPIVLTDEQAITKGCQAFGSTAAIRSASATPDGAQPVGFDVLYLVTIPAGGGYLKLETPHTGPYGIFLETGVISGASLAGPGEPPTLATVCATGTPRPCGCKADAGYRVALGKGTFTVFLESAAGGEASISLHDLTKPAE